MNGCIAGKKDKWNNYNRQNDCELVIEKRGMLTLEQSLTAFYVRNH